MKVLTQKFQQVRQSIALAASCIVLTMSIPVLPAQAQSKTAVPSGLSTNLSAVQPDVPARKGSAQLVRIEPKVSFSGTPSDLEIQTARIFTEPLVPMDGASSEGENAALGQKLTAYKAKKNPEELSDLLDFLSQFPNSKWRPSLELCIGTLKKETGYTSEALEYFRSSWDLSKEATGVMQTNFANKAFAEYVTMLARLGRVEELELRLASVRGRPFHGAQEAAVSNCKQSISCLKNEPEAAYRCGPLALDSIQNKGNRVLNKNSTFRRYPSSAKGTNLAELKILASKGGLKYQAAKRSKGAPFVVPCVVHWKTDHFSAITSKQGGKFHVQDPTFNAAGNSWITEKALDSETDGYFLVPAGGLPKGWKSVSAEESSGVWGKGGELGRTAPSSNDPTNGSSGSGSSSNQCKGSCDCMPVSSVYRMQATLNIRDNPLFYTPAVGTSMDFMLNYDHMEQGQPTNFTFSNVGPCWSLNWISYLTVDASANASVMISGGGLEYYPFAVTDNLNNPYAPNLTSQAVLSVSQSGERYTRSLPDGSIEVFDQGDTTGRFYMTQVIDPQGHKTLIQYDSNYRVTTITDAKLQVTTFSYVSNTIGNPGYYKVSQISDPFSRTASITYDDISGSISSITDAGSLRTDFTYDSTSSFINLMITPYGATSFRTYTYDDGSDTMLGLRTQFPDGSATVLENWIRHENQTYYWDREQLSLYPNEPGHNTGTIEDGDFHCTKWQFMRRGLEEVPCARAVKPPLESVITYTYDGQADPHPSDPLTYFVGVSDKPIEVSRIVDGYDSGGLPITEIQKSKYLYNSFGNVLESIDPLGRTFQYKYDANNIDLLEVRQTRDGTNDLLGKWVFDDKHLPLYSIDGSGQKTTYSYNAEGQVASIVDAAGNTSTMTYDSNNRLTQIDGPMPGSGDTTTFTWYGFGLVHTATNSEGSTTLYTYDSLLRPIAATYPDGTTEQTVYDKLDAVLIKDRNGRWSQSVFDSLDRLVLQTDPLGRKTKYTWCDCGSLASLTDGNNNTTTWHHDVQGRVIQKIFADSTDIDYTYETNTSRLKSRTDALNQITGYKYNVDNTLARVEYSNEVNPTSDIAITYDLNYNRTKTVQNGWGTNTYVYNPYINDPFKAAHIWMGGKPTPGDRVNLNVTTSIGTTNIQHVVTGSESTLDDLAVGVRNDINVALSAQGVAATSNRAYVSFSAPPAAGSVTIALSTNGPVTETIGGSVTTNDVISITFKDSALSGGVKTKSYTTSAGDTPTAIATALTTAITSDTELASKGMTATSSGTVITITSTSPNATTISENVSPGGTETITRRGGAGETATQGGGGRLQSVANDVISNSQVSYSYDLLGRTVTRAIDGASNTISWRYDEMSRVTSEANLLGTFKYNYVDNDTDNNKSKGVTRLASINYPNNQVTNFDWYNNNGDERLKQIQNLDPTGKVLSQFNYRYNPAGEITQWPQIQNGLSRFQSLGYDLAGQLTSSQISDAQPSNKYLNQDYYAYDPGANRTGNQTNQVQNIAIGGTKTTGDVLTVTVKDSGLSGGQQAVNYTVQAGDTLTTIAENMAAAITLDSNLQSLGVNATSSSTTVSIRSVSPNITTYATSTSGGAAETLKVGTTQNFIQNTTIALKPGQSITTGETLTLKVLDPALDDGTHHGYQDVSYAITAGNTLPNIATGLKNAINANSHLAGEGITATSAGATVTIKSTSANPTVYRDITDPTYKEYLDLNICPNKVETIGVSGTKTTSDVMTVVFLDSGLSGGSKTVNYTVLAGDTLTSIASGISSAINADTALQAIGVSSSSSGTIVSITSSSPNVTSYRASTNANATEIVKLGLPPNGTQTAVIGGTKTTGNVLTITVYDAGLAGGSKAINYTVQSGDTLTSMTSGLASAITADSSLAAIGVSATAVSTVVNIKSTSQNATTYTSSLSGGATATISLAKTIGAQLSAYNNVNELTSIAAGGPVRFQASTNKALKSGSVNSNPATLTTTKNFVRDESISSGASAASVAATDGANNTKTNTYQVNVNPVSAQNLTYDANGNMTSDGTNTFKWDAEDRLIEIGYPGIGNKSEFTYESNGNLSKIVEKTNNSVVATRQFIDDEERDGAGVVTKQFFSRGEVISSANYYFLLDHSSSITEMTDAASNVVSKISYDSFGRLTQTTGGMTPDYLYAGYFFHAKSGLYITSNRLYSPKLGRWLNRDPIEEQGGINMYAYVNNSPINFRDPSGLTPITSLFLYMKAICDDCECVDKSDRSKCTSDALLIKAAVVATWGQHRFGKPGKAEITGNAMDGVNGYLCWDYATYFYRAVINVRSKIWRPDYQRWDLGINKKGRRDVHWALRLSTKDLDKCTLVLDDSAFGNGAYGELHGPAYGSRGSSMYPVEAPSDRAWGKEWQGIQ